LSTSQKVFVLQIHRFFDFCRNRLSGKMIFSHFCQYLSDFSCVLQCISRPRITGRGGGLRSLPEELPPVLAAPSGSSSPFTSFCS